MSEISKKEKRAERQRLAYVSRFSITKPRGEKYPLAIANHCIGDDILLRDAETKLLNLQKDGDSRAETLEKLITNFDFQTARGILRETIYAYN